METPTAEKVTITLPTLNAGEAYAGLILKEDCTPDYHLVLIPGALAAAKWDEAMEWAKNLDADLPARREQSLLFANAGQHFEKDWYWSNAQHASYSAFAWYQGFYHGRQDYDFRIAKLRARAVRRLPV